MQKLIITRGLPASGKSTWAEEYINSQHGNTKRINKDKLREMLDFGVWGALKEKLVEKLHNFLLLQLLQTGYDVIVDNTHLHKKYPDVYLNYLKGNGFDISTLEVIEQDFTHVSIAECIERDSKRTNSVGAAAIKRLASDGIKHGFYTGAEKSIPTTKRGRVWNEKPFELLPYCVIVDLDGTLADFGDANPYDRNFMEDKVNTRIRYFLKSLPEDFTIIILSGRTDKFIDVTRNWLEINNVEYDNIYMRDNGDKRGDEIVKKEFYQNYIQGKYNVFCIFDDRPKIVRQWREMGLYVFDCNQSGENF